MRGVTVLCVALLALAACGSTPDPGPLFDDGGGAEITCLQHQAASPGTRYTDEGTRRSDEVLKVLRYYTANGAKPYCDGGGASADDKSWADLYTRLGADRANVRSIVD